MNIIYLDQELLHSLAWQSAGSLSVAPSPFGLVVKNETGGYWIIKDKDLLELELSPCGSQYLIRDRTSQTSIGLFPFSLGRGVDRFISWLQLGTFNALPVEIGTEITRIEAEKTKLLIEFDDGNITAKEFLTGLERMQSQEICLRQKREREISSLVDFPLKKRRILGSLLFALISGFLICLAVKPMMFGYNNAEECVLAKGGSKYTFSACYELYPTVSETRANPHK